MYLAVIDRYERAYLFSRRKLHIYIPDDRRSPSGMMEKTTEINI
jgi:hypothetical protein